MTRDGGNEGDKFSGARPDTDSSSSPFPPTSLSLSPSPTQSRIHCETPQQNTKNMHRKIPSQTALPEKVSHVSIDDALTTDEEKIPQQTLQLL
ncbi:hypothetical protein GcM1_239109 [Golovinomyces cichoracearum]|uniref:Uncharacterized protein n=1 Tax=Golovinomyces cichoracearum TaxID=62708 RepID=A0A420IIZ1_9PEZI|nr:hypothetical protein GcM1_239109 [Golovinomyces cichoracearum]